MDTLEDGRVGEPLVHALVERFGVSLVLDMLREAGTVEDEVGQAYPLDLEEVRGHPVGEGRHLVGHQRGHVGKAGLKGSRTRRRHEDTVDKCR